MNLGIPLSDWLSKLHEFHTQGSPFVVATVVSFSGSSPERHGACVFYSERQSASFVNSQSRRDHMLANCKSLLNSGLTFQLEEQALGTVAGTDNGQCIIIYETFTAADIPTWLSELRNNLEQRINTQWLRIFDPTKSEVHNQLITAQTSKRELEALGLSFNENLSSCQLIQRKDCTMFLRATLNTTVSLLLVGHHPVAHEIKRQLSGLPIIFTHVDSIEENCLGNLARPTHVVIMTGDHNLDYRYCQAALHHPAITFLGCIGSAKKARLFKSQLKQQGASTEQANRLTMPIGLSQISGKQTAIVAASVVAQLLSLHPW